MSGAMDCVTARAMLPALLDGELTGADLAAIETHAAGCPACRAESEAAAADSRRLRSLAGTHRAPAPLRARIGAAFDAADRAATTARPPWRRFRHALAAAAAVVLLLAGATAGFLFAREPAERRIAVDVMASHLRALIADKLVDVASSDKHTVRPWFNGRVDIAPPVEDMTEQGYRLAGGRVDYIGERRVAVLVYRHRQHVIDLYVWPAAASTAPVMMARRGYNLSTWAAHGLTFWAITDLNAPDLDRFVGFARARFGQPDAR